MALSSSEDFVFDFLRIDQVEEWLSHLTEVFPDPRSYFAGHLHNDVTPDLQGIRIAVDKKSGKIVSTVRVFIRKMFWDGAVYSVGGIGEVSTNAAFRGKGLASKLLQDALEYMRAHELHVSSLHTSKAAPVYAKLGWRAVPRFYIRRPIEDLIKQAALATYASAGVFGTVFAGEFSDTGLVDALMPLYSQYAARWNGTFVRASHRYWQQWVPNEPQLALAVGTRAADGSCVLEAYAAFGPKKREESVLVLKDFSVSKELFERDRGFNALLLLLHRYLTEFGGRTASEAESVRREFSEFIYPHCIFGDAAPFHADWRQVDLGTMYRSVDLPGMQDKLENSDPSRHLFWNMDSF